MSSSYKIAEDLWLVHASFSTKAQAAAVDLPVHHIAVVDCSGSMSADLPNLRAQLKSFLPKNLSENDTFSCVWFSGKGEASVLLERETAKSLKDIQRLQTTLEKWLRPVGLTGFVDPLKLVADLASRLKGAQHVKGAEASQIAVLFMTDGCDNQWSVQEILKAVEGAAGRVESTTFVEYGYYADRAMLARMAEKAGGSHIFASDFHAYEPVFEREMTRKIRVGKRVKRKVDSEVIGSFAFALHDGDLLTFELGVDGHVVVPEGVEDVWYLSPVSVGVKQDLQAHTRYVAAAYAAVSLFSMRMRPKVVWPLLKELGDVQFIDAYAQCFGKQRYSEFQEAAKEATFKETRRYLEGKNRDRVPDDNAFTLLELFDVLSSDDKNVVLFEHPDFQYSRITRARTVDEDSKAAGLRFEEDPVVRAAGYPIEGLVWNESRPNLSFRVQKPGVVDLSLCIGLPAKVPEKFPTFVWRNRAVVADGLVHVNKLPCRISEETLDKLLADERFRNTYKVLDHHRVDPTTAKSVVFDLKRLPILNRRQVTEISAKEFFHKKFALVEQQAAQKVYGAYRKLLLPGKVRESKGFPFLYGEDGAKFLKELGFSDNGFNPVGQVQVASTDYYMGRELKVGLRSFNDLPSLSEANAAIEAARVKRKDPKPSVQLMMKHIAQMEAFQNSKVYTSAADKPAVLEAWLDGEFKAARANCRKLIYEIARTTFALIVGQVWFKEFGSLEENAMTISAGGFEIACSAEMVDVKVPI